jgi:hypothetical protein
MAMNDLPATDSAKEIHDLVGDDATATFEDDPKFTEPTPGSEGSSDNLQEKKDREEVQNEPDLKLAAAAVNALSARDSDDTADSDKELARKDNAAAAHEESEEAAENDDVQTDGADDAVSLSASADADEDADIEDDEDDEDDELEDDEEYEEDDEDDDGEAEAADETDDEDEEDEYDDDEEDEEDDEDAEELEAGSAYSHPLSRPLPHAPSRASHALTYRADGLLGYEDEAEDAAKGRDREQGDDLREHQEETLKDGEPQPIAEDELRARAADSVPAGDLARPDPRGAGGSFHEESDLNRNLEEDIEETNTDAVADRALGLKSFVAQSMLATRALETMVDLRGSR